MSLLADAENTLRKAFAPQRLNLRDESDLHKGHEGVAAEAKDGITHIRLEMTAKAFNGLSKLERHRRVHHALAEILDGGLHSLSMSLRASDEDN